MLQISRAVALALACLFAFTIASPLQAQQSSVFVGTISDPTGARIPGATVHFSGKAGTRDVTTDAVGHFSARLPAGSYALTVTASGFVTLQRPAVAVPAGNGAELPLTLAISADTAVVNVDAAEADNTDPENNRSALTFSGNRLATLSDDDTTFQMQIQAMAGDGDSGGSQPFVDGFSGGRFPPKTAIREIRINSNPYSAQFDDYGFGRIEVFTKPGADKLHGNLDIAGNDQSFNAHNPYTGVQPPYHDIYFDGNLTGPMGKNTSYFLAANRIDQQNNAVVNAATLDVNGNPVTTSEAVPNPQTSDTVSARLDRQMNEKNTFTGRYEWNNAGQANSGVGLLVLPSEGVTTSTAIQTLQLSDTQTSGASTVIETRFEYIRTRLRQTPDSTAPTLVVQGSFSGGGNGSQSIIDNQDHYELQEYISRAFGTHFLHAGGRFRVNREANTSTGGYNGAYTFPSLTAYQLTVQGLASGLSPAAIRAEGGGPSQFNLTAGAPSAAVSTADLGVYAEDDWKLRPDLTLSYGLRLESQTAIPDHFDPAPRISAAYSLLSGGKRKEPLAVLRSGFGIFYDRFAIGNLLTAIRQSGASQLSYYVENPDFYPAIPAPAGLPSTEPTIYRISPDLHTQYAMIGNFSAEHSFGEKGSISVNYRAVRGDHQYLSRNINAPLPGTYNTADPNSGTRPFGGMQNIYQFSSDGIRHGQVFSAHADLQPTKRLSTWVGYNVQHRRTDSSGPNSFPSNQFDLAQDYGRPAIAFQRLYSGMWFSGPEGIETGMFLAAHSGVPFNITTGTDLNGDTQFNDRPAFATDLSRPSVVRTRLGNFDTQPIAGQTIVPINYGNSPGYVSLQIEAGKSFGFGPRPAPEKMAAGQPARTEKPDPRYRLRFSVEAQNVLNHTNPGVPVGVLSSPYFGRSISLADSFSGITAANRTVTVHSSFNF